MKQFQFFAVSAPGLESVLLDEIKGMDIGKAKMETGGVAFGGDMRRMQRANLQLRTASRVLLRVASFHATAFHELERNVKRIAWNEFITAGTHVSLRVTCKKSKLYHSDAVAERIANAIAQKTGARLFADDAPDDSSSADDDGDVGNDDTGSSQHQQLVVVRVFHDQCSISADTSGAHLHMRGYREATAKAPLRETLGAALIGASDWHGESPLLDPMCGAGTIPIEAALIARGIAPGLARSSRQPRNFAFEYWPGHDAANWKKEVAMAQSRIVERSPVRILASDRDAGAIAAAIANAERAGVAADIEIEQKTISTLSRPEGNGLIVCNPPYGKRVGDSDRLRDLYAKFGNVLRNDWQGWRLTLLSGNTTLSKQLRLEMKALMRSSNGGIPVEILSAEI